MTTRPLALAQAKATSTLSQIRLVATDMDGTLTSAGEFTPALLQSFESLSQKGIDVMIVTGRSAGWVSGLVNYLPVVGAIAENGGVYIDKKSLEPEVLPDIPRMSQHRDRLAMVFRRLKKKYPHLRPSVDNVYRLTDWTLDIHDLTEDDMAQIKAFCESQTMGFTYSNVQCHIQVGRQNKAAGLARVLQKKFGQLDSQSVLTVGDSPNDETLFDAKQFPNSVGVANVVHYLPNLAHAPAYIARHPEVEGFVELTQLLTSEPISQ